MAEGMQVQCRLRFSGQENFVNILQTSYRKFSYNIYKYCSPVDTSSNADGIINSLNKVFIIIIIKELERLEL